MRFANPQMLWLLPVTVGLLGWFLVWAWRKKQALMTAFIQSRLLPQLTVGVSPTREKARLVLLVLAVTCIFLALAQPQWGFDWEEAKQRGLDIVVAIDTSRSMLADDVRPNRLVRAKLAALDLMRLTRSDRLGLVAFAGTAFLQCPLTLDDEAFRQSVDALEVNIIPQGGTAITAAIETALTAFKDENNFKILVLFSDGEDHDSGALTTAEKAAKAGLRIFAIGVGTPNGELLRQADEKGIASYIKDEQGNVVKSRLNEGLLQQVATATSGFYLPLRSANAMPTLYEQGLAPLPKSEIASRLIRHYHERFHWPLAAALLLLVAEALLPQRKREARAQATPAPTSPSFGSTAGLAFALLLTAAGQASPAQARQQYDAGHFQAAQTEYQKLLEKKPDDPRLHYNAGAAAYRAEAYEQAAKSLTNACASADLELQQRAFYNLGDSLYRLGEQTPDLQSKLRHWEDAVRSFDGALKLNPKDQDAKFNLEFVKKKLEELKQQQAQQEQSDRSKQDKTDHPDQKQQPDSQPKDSDASKDQQKQRPPQQPQPKNESPKQDQQPEPENRPDKPSDKDQQKPPDQAQPAGQPGQDKAKEKPAESTETAAPQPATGQMTLQQAQQLLDAQKDEEQALIFIPINRTTNNQARSFKDW